MTPFHDVPFPAALSRGFSGGPEWRVEITELANGYEVPNLPWADSRRRYSATIGQRGLSDPRAVAEFFEARRGSYYAFPWLDHIDYSSVAADASAKQAPGLTDQAIGTGDGVTTAFQLTKTYGVGSPDPFVRMIALPILATVRVAVDGIEVTPDTVSRPGGVVTLPTAPANGVAVTAGFEFEVPVRFDIDRLDVSFLDYDRGAIQSVPVVEVRL